MKTDGGRGGAAAVCNAGVHNPKSGCTICASPASANHCNTVHLTASHHSAAHCNTVHLIASQCIPLQHSASHCNTVHLIATQCISLQHLASHYNSVHPLHLIPLHHPPLHQGQAALAPWAKCGAGELGSIRWRFFFDKAPRLSIRIDIWIVYSDTICQLNQLHTNREAALAPWAGCRRPGVDQVAFVLCAPSHFEGSGGFVFIIIINIEA